MEIPGSIYKTKKNEIYVGLYNYWPEVYRRAPLKLREKSDYVAHVSYSFGGNSRGIDIFLLKDKKHNINDEVDVKRGLIESKENLEYVDVRHNICTEIVAQYDNQAIRNLIRKDIKDFSKREAKHPGQNHIVRVPKIIPRTEIRKIKQKEYLKGGKQEFVPSCALDTNLDFSWGCPSGFVPENGSSFDGKIFTNYFLDIWAECQYCYAAFQHKSFAKYILDIDKKQLTDELKKAKGKKDSLVLRLGKRTEAGSKFTLDSLITTLEACIETGTRAIMPTKFLEFDRDISKLLKKSNSVVLYSIGYDELEKGACAYGHTNEWRIEQCTRYREDGVNSVLYLHVDLPHKPTKREHKILEYAIKKEIPVQLLSIRIPSKRVAKKLIASSWEELKTDNGQILLDIVNKSENHGGYKWKTNIMVAQEKHESYLFLVGKNNWRVRLCHHDDKETYCGRCFLDNKGFIIPTQKVNLNYRNKSSWRKEKRKGGRKKSNTSLFEHT